MSNKNSINSHPNKQLGFEIDPRKTSWVFTPEFYPDDFTQMKKKELNRYGSGACSGESVSIKSIKNREIHVSGVILHGEIRHFQSLIDLEEKVDLLSPLTSNGGLECVIKSGELGNQKGWDPMTNQRMFKFTLDLVSTGRDERDSSQNAIVTAIMSEENSKKLHDHSDMSCSYKGHPRTEYIYSGDAKNKHNRWERCNMTTSEFQRTTEEGNGTGALKLDPKLSEIDAGSAGGG